MVEIALASSVARADASFGLTWRPRPGSTTCVSAPVLQDAVEKKLGRKALSDREHADILIEGEEDLSGGRFRARLVQRSRSGVVLGSRELEAQSCAGLLRTATIVVALFIEPGGGREPEEHGPPAVPSDDGPADVEPAPRERSAVEPPARRPRPTPLPLHAEPLHTRAPLELALGLGGGAAVGLLPSVSAEVRASARLEHARSRWSFEWAAGYSLPQALRAGTVRGTFAAIEQQVRTCFAFVDASSVRLDACGGGLFGAILPTTAGVREGNDAWRPIGGPMGAVAAELRDGGRALRFDLALVALPVRRSLYYVTSEAEPALLYSTGRVIGFAGFTGLFTIF